MAKPYNLQKLSNVLKKYGHLDKLIAHYQKHIDIHEVPRNEWSAMKSSLAVLLLKGIEYEQRKQ